MAAPTLEQCEAGRPIRSCAGTVEGLRACWGEPGSFTAETLTSSKNATVQQVKVVKAYIPASPTDPDAQP
ncbi:hypothetical protein [Pseudoclavibacter soli]|uniref:hypothetical protein n=1 Tax=Pseudoclavibacter soli TaxID=452623 RepID=UPI0003F7D1EF|nr:hypothetical protein [Pseudoclavibacter soli]